MRKVRDVLRLKAVGLSWRDTARERQIHPR